MKKILITGANSYIGTSFEKYLRDNYPGDYSVDTIDMIDGSWRDKDFAGYDSVFHVAGIAHMKETPENAQLYYRINRDLAEDTAKKAKSDGVRQFVFMSTMAVYGIEEGEVDLHTHPNPISNYGKAKWEAEQRLAQLRSSSFAVAVLRPPMVYGDGCKGNYQFLIKLARVMPFFPDYDNKRSMIHIDRLCGHVRDLVDNCTDGLILPQDETYVCTCRMVKDIAARMGRNLKLTKLLNPMVYLAKRFTRVGRKAFGDLYYKR